MKTSSKQEPFIKIAMRSGGTCMACVAPLITAMFIEQPHLIGLVAFCCMFLAIIGCIVLQQGSLDWPSEKLKSDKKLVPLTDEQLACLDDILDNIVDDKSVTDDDVTMEEDILCIVRNAML